MKIVIDGCGSLFIDLSILPLPFHLYFKPPQLKCAQCLQRFPSSSELRAHFASHREEWALALQRNAVQGRGGAPNHAVTEEIAKAAALLDQQEKALQNGLTNGR